MMSPPSAPDAGALASERERWLRALFDHSFLYLAVLDGGGTVLDANPALRKLAGEAGAALAGTPLWAAPFWDAESGAAAALRAAVASAAAGAFCRREMAVSRSAGGALLDVSLTPVMDAAGAVSLVIVEARDVTEAKWAERALRVSEAKFAGIVSIASDAIISIDASQSILHFNHGAEVIFGYRAEEVLGRQLDLLIPERFRAAHRDHVRTFGESAVAARRMGERAEILGLRSDGTEFPADASISKLEVDGQRIYTVVLRDVSARKKAERAQQFLARAGPLLATSLDYETTVRSITRLAVPTLGDWTVLYVTDRAGAVSRLELAHADPAAAPLLATLDEYPLAAVPGHPVFAVVARGTPVLVPHVDEALLAAMSVDARHRSLYRELGLASLMVVPLAARGRTVGALGFYAAARVFDEDDLAFAGEVALRAALAIDNARLYREAQDALQARDDVLAVVSHDLGNPLSAIRIGTSLLLRRRPAGDADESWQHLDAIRQSVSQMERLIDDLLEVKRLEAGHLALERRPQQPASLVAETGEVLGGMAAEKGQTLETRVAAALPAVHVDRQRALQVLSNIVGNAIKFTPTGGRITVTADALDGFVCFAVADTGPGIPDANLARIFDRFWQGRKEGRAGIGLGLAIARGIVEAHGGRIWAESEVGAGTTIRFTLPPASRES
jgi:PAS domain S-box-containing protein